MRKQEHSPDAMPHKDREARTSDAARQEVGGDGPGRMGLTSDEQPDLVAPSGVDERDHGAADDKPVGGGSAPLGPPGAGLSDRNGPSDRGSADR